jgi:hypothetical protein
MTLNRKFAGLMLALTLAVTGLAVRSMLFPVVHAQSARVFEMRTYYAAEGKFDALKARFRDHTIRMFNKHGMVSIGYWAPQAGQAMTPNTLVYILAYPSRDAATKSWAAFNADPEWVKAKAESEKDGRLIAKVESVFLDPTDFSAIK